MHNLLRLFEISIIISQRCVGLKVGLNQTHNQNQPDVDLLTL